MATSDEARSNPTSCSSRPGSMSEDDVPLGDYEPPARPPVYSQQPVDGVDYRAQSPSTLLSVHRQTPPSGPPPKYQHPPPYRIHWTAGEADPGELRIHGGPDPTLSAACREYLRTRTSPSNKNWPHYILACFVFWFCGFLFGAVALLLIVLAHKESTTQSQALLRASLATSTVGIVAGFTLLMFVLVLNGSQPPGCVVVFEHNDTIKYWSWREPTTMSPEVTTSAPCHVIGNETTCFRFASNFTASQCSSVDGVLVNSSSSVVASTATCYHNVCTRYVVNMSCFEFRTSMLDRDRCYAIYGYYSIELSGRACYYNGCPGGHMASNNKCYRYKRLRPSASACQNGFYEHGYCFFNDTP